MKILVVSGGGKAVQCEEVIFARMRNALIENVVFGRIRLSEGYPRRNELEEIEKRLFCLKRHEQDY